MFNYLKESFRRKKARRVTQEYPGERLDYQIEPYGNIQFAKWTNPLAPKFELTSNMVSFFRKFIKEGDLVIDIGANIGDTTVPMALCAGTTGMAIGFDPNPIVFKMLTLNSSLNKAFTNIKPENFAISVKDEEFFFVSSEASFANGGISPENDGRHGKFVLPQKIKGVNLEEFLASNYSNWVDKFSFVKVDTEGYDKEILKSISGLLSKYKPVIIAESFGKASDEAKIELYEVISNLGYDIFYFQDFDINAAIIKLENKEDITKWKNTINIYAVAKA
jgi:FkbM family methyltransferase